MLGVPRPRKNGLEQADAAYAAEFDRRVQDPMRHEAFFAPHLRPVVPIVVRVTLHDVTALENARKVAENVVLSAK